MYHVNKA